MRSLSVLLKEADSSYNVGGKMQIKKKEKKRLQMVSDRNPLNKLFA